MDIAEIQGILERLADLLKGIEDLYGALSPWIQWIIDNWVAVALTGEIIGGALAVILGRYRVGFGWLLAAVGTIWLGGAP